MADSDDLQREMERVKRSMEQLASRNVFMRVLASGDEQVKLADFKARIQTVLDVFRASSLS